MGMLRASGPGMKMSPTDASIFITLVPSSSLTLVPGAVEGNTEAGTRSSQPAVRMTQHDDGVKNNPGAEDMDDRS